MSKFIAGARVCSKCGRAGESSWITCPKCGGLMTLAAATAPVEAPQPAAAVEGPGEPKCPQCGDHRWVNIGSTTTTNDGGRYQCQCGFLYNWCPPAPAPPAESGVKWVAFQSFAGWILVPEDMGEDTSPATREQAEAAAAWVNATTGNLNGDWEKSFHQNFRNGHFTCHGGMATVKAFIQATVSRLQAELAAAEVNAPPSGSLAASCDVASGHWHIGGFASESQARTILGVLRSRGILPEK